MIFLGKRSFNLSKRKEPKPEPVPPAIECSSMNPYAFVSVQVSLMQKMRTYLQTVATVRLALDHLHQLFLHCPRGRIPGSPIVPRTGAFFVYIHILRVVDFPIAACLYAMDHARL